MKRRSIFRSARMDLKKLEAKKIKIERRIEKLRSSLGSIIVLMGQLEQIPTGGNNAVS